MTFALLSSLRRIGLLLLAGLLAWIASKPESHAAAGGALVGFGIVTLALFLAANASCSVPGSCYEASPALPATAALVLAGLGLSAVGLRRK